MGGNPSESRGPGAERELRVKGVCCIYNNSVHTSYTSTLDTHYSYTSVQRLRQAALPIPGLLPSAEHIVDRLFDIPNIFLSSEASDR